MSSSDYEFFVSLLGGEDKLDGGFGKSYNIFAMEQGIVIAEALQTEESILDFRTKSWEDQKSLVPLLDDGHSGNTFGMSLRFALAYLPQLKVNKRDEKIDDIIQ
jgi:hypothetical protein